MTSIYDFLRKPEWEEIPLLTTKVRSLIVVNTATGCGLTPQYQGLHQISTSATRKRAGNPRHSPATNSWGGHQELQKKSIVSAASTTRPPSHDSPKPRSMVKKPFLFMTGSKAKQLGHWANASNGTSQNLSSTDKAKSPNASPPKQNQLPWKT